MSDVGGDWTHPIITKVVNGYVIPFFSQVLGSPFRRVNNTYIYIYIY